MRKGNRIFHLTTWNILSVSSEFSSSLSWHYSPTREGCSGAPRGRHFPAAALPPKRWSEDNRQRQSPQQPESQTHPNARLAGLHRDTRHFRRPGAQMSCQPGHSWTASSPGPTTVLTMGSKATPNRPPHKAMGRRGKRSASSHPISRHQDPSLWILSTCLLQWPCPHLPCPVHPATGRPI